MCQLLGGHAHPIQVAVSIKEAKMSRPMRKLGTEIHHHMAISNASLRQPILTRQYMALASFPGFATTKSLFYDHELWYRDDALRLYFDKFNLVLATEFVQVVIAPLFTPHACFHLQMLKDYIMPTNVYDVLQESQMWASHCSLDTGHETNSFVIAQPNHLRVKNIQAALKKWCKYDAQFYLGDGVFTIAPTNVFLALNGVSPEDQFANEQSYCKMVIKKKESKKGLRPSHMWTEFWNSHKHLTCFLDEETLIRNIVGEVVEVQVPHVWAEPIPGTLISCTCAFLRSHFKFYIVHACLVSIRSNLSGQRTFMGRVPTVHGLGA